MTKRSVGTGILAVVLSFLAVISTAPFSAAETIAALPLGVIVTSGTVTVGNSAAPAGTTVFSGDRIAAASEPALVNFSSGSRVELIQAAATFSREGKALLVQASKGLFRFHFIKGEKVLIIAGKYSLTAVGEDSAHTGELGLDGKGQIALALTEGAFDSVNTATGERTAVLPDSPLIVSDQGGAAKGAAGATPGWSGKKVAAIVAGVGGVAALGIGVLITFPPPPPKSPCAR